MCLYLTFAKNINNNEIIFIMVKSRFMKIKDKTTNNLVSKANKKKIQKTLNMLSPK